MACFGPKDGQDLENPRHPYQKFRGVLASHLGALYTEKRGGVVPLTGAERVMGSNRH